jgi:NRAMP (natural resistance-associated macrophage protein)-like metal ion transporter
MAPVSVRSRRPSKDPILEKLTSEHEPPTEEILKEQPAGDSPAATPSAGRAAVEEISPRRPTTLLQVLGPGLVTGASDDDPSGIGTYSQVGSQFGYGFLWTALFTLPLMAAVQEMCARIALQTGVGLGVSLRRKFPTIVVAPCILGLLIANTINVGADLGAVAAGGSLLTHGAIPTSWLVVPVAALILGLQLFATYATIFRVFKWLTLALFAYVITGFFAHPDGGEVLRATFIPHLELSAAFIAGMVAVLGTTISPYLFFWQASSEVDEMQAAGLTTEAQRRGVKLSELKAARVDIFTGMLFSNAVMYFIILTSAAVLHTHGQTNVQTAAQAAGALAPVAGQYAFILFSLGLIGTGLLAVPILSGSAAYALREFFNLHGTMATKPRYRPTFYLIIALATLAGVGMNFLGIDPIRALFVTAVINGLAAPPLLLLIVLLAADRTMMQNRVSGRLSLTITCSATVIMSLAGLALLATTAGIV